MNCIFKLHLKCHYVQLWNHIDWGKLEGLLLFYMYLFCTQASLSQDSVHRNVQSYHACVCRGRYRSTKTRTNKSLLTNLSRPGQNRCIHNNTLLVLSADVQYRGTNPINHVISLFIHFNLNTNQRLFFTDNSADFYKAERQQRNRGDVYQGNVTLVEWLPEL